MFAKIFAIFALFAVALAAPSPNPAPAPKPQLLAYSSGLDYAYPSAYVPSVVSPYAAAPLAASPYAAAPLAASPFAYSGYPAVAPIYY